MNCSRLVRVAAFAVLSLASGACGHAEQAMPTSVPISKFADLVLYNARVYSLRWDDPDPEGRPSAQAPLVGGRWRPDADAVAIKGERIVAVGSYAALASMVGASTRLIDLKQAVVVPGLVDGHTHVEELGEQLDVIDLHGSATPDEAIQRVKAALKMRPVAPGEWIVARGWDEGAWANSFPNAALLDEHFPHNPVHMDGAYGFVGWGNSAAMRLAGIDRNTTPPVGGQIEKDAAGEPTDIVMNRGVTLYRNAVPERSVQQLKQQLLFGLGRLAEAGYVMVHHAGVAPRLMRAYQELADEGKLPVRVYAMLSGRDKEQLTRWMAKGPYTHPGNRLVVRSVKGYYDGSLGARGAKLMTSYSDRAGHHGLAGADYGFLAAEISQILQRGFQINIHAIGDAANREVLDFFERNFEHNPATQRNRHRVEHAQVVHPDDFARFGSLKLIASVQPPSVAEDMRWAVDRIGPARVKGAYAWRSFRRHNVRLVFGSDLTRYDFDVFYGLHSAIARQDRSLRPQGGWQPGQRLSPEEALLGYTKWAAFSAFMEHQMGLLKEGYWAELTVLDTDVLRIGAEAPSVLLGGKVLMTMVGGIIVHSAL